MAPLAFNIPAEYAADLRVLDHVDSRTNEEIVAGLRNPPPITSEKNIWCYWDKGIEQMAGWCLQNVCDWARMTSSGDKPWTVRVLDNIPSSPNFALKFIPENMLPQCFVKGEMEGRYTAQHSADFLRTASVLLYGGIFMDVSCILFRHPDRIGWEQLENPSSPFQIAVPLMYGTIMANHFVMCRKGDPFIKRWHELFVHLWKDRRTHEGICDDPLIHFGSTFDFEAAKASNLNWDFKVEPRAFFEYIAQILAWSRLTGLDDAGDGFSCTQYWQKNILLFDALEEDWAAEATVGFDGEDVIKILKTPLNADPASQEFRAASRLIWRLLTRSSMQKFVGGKDLANIPTSGDLLNLTENAQAHNQPGTFAQLLRFGSVHFEQTREDIARREAKVPTETVKKGILEP